MSVINDILAISSEATRLLHGEPVELFDAAGESLQEITDALVTLDSAAVGVVGSGPATESGVIRLAETYHAVAVTAQHLEYQGRRWYVGHVGDVKGGLFRVEVSRGESGIDGRHTNLIDLHGNQIPYADE
jgi:hypothetical protein